LTLIVDPDFDQLSSIKSDSNSFSNYLSGNQNVFQYGIVNISKSSVSWNVLFVIWSRIDDGSFGNNKNVLFSLFAQIIGDLFDLAFIFLMVREGQVNHEGSWFIFFIVYKFKLFYIGYFGIFEVLGISLICICQLFEVLRDLLK